MHDPRAISNFILDTKKFLGGDTTQLELQKLLYFAHATWLVGSNGPLVSGMFEAWQFGPVHPSVYQAFKHNGALAITDRAKSRNIITGEVRMIPRPEKAIQRHIVKVVSMFFDMSATQLVDLTHAKGGPWDVVWRQKDSKGAIISDRTIIEHYGRHSFPLSAVEERDARIIDTDVPPYDN